MKNETINKSANLYQRILTIILCVFITILVVYNYFVYSPKGEIGSELIILLLILVILVLAESFDSFSIGKLLAISKEKKVSEKRTTVLEKKNSELLDRIISIVSIQNQNQSNINVLAGDSNKTPIAQEQHARNSKNDKKENLLEEPEVSKTMRFISDSIKKVLEENGYDYDNKTSKLLISHLAYERLNYSFFITHREIFGSQISLLKLMNNNQGEGVGELYIEDYFKKVKKENPNSFLGWTHENFIEYLVTVELIVKEENTYKITYFGVEYLTWLVKIGYQEDKLY